MTSSAASWWRHIRETWRLAGPIIVARSAFLLMFTFDTLAAGQVSSRELALIGLGTAPQITVALVAVGALQPVAVLVAQAIGAGERAATGAILRAGIIHAVGFSLLLVLLAPFIEGFFVAAGQDAGLAAGAARVMWLFVLGAPGMLVFTAVAHFLDATGRQRAAMIMMAGALAIDVPANLVFASGWGGLSPALGALGAVGTSAAARTVACIGLVVFLVLDQRRLGDPHRALVPLATWIAEIRALGGAHGGKIRRLGLPMGLAQGVESAAFATVMLIAGTIGATALAAHQVMMTLITLVYMLSVGMAGATAIRVGNAVGAGGRGDARRASLAGIGIGSLAPLPLAALFLTRPDLLGTAFTSDALVLAVTERTLFLAGFLLAFDAAAGIVMGALRGLGDIWVPTILQTSAYWVVAVPLAFHLGHRLEPGAVGLVIALFAGIVASLVLLAPRLVRVLARPLRRA